MNAATATTLVVLAHPEPRSFNGAWARSSRDASLAAGHEVLFSDLVASGFDPVERREHYDGSGEAAPGSDAPFDPLRFQRQASSEGQLPADVAAEIARIRSADRLILHFPLWWFGPPAILKGWLDRCLAHGALHDSAQRFDNGMCRGKKALLCVSTGSSAMESSAAGKEGDATLLLWPLAYALRYVGFTVLRPELVHGVHGFHEPEAGAALETRLQETLAAQSSLIARFDELPTIAFNRDDEFDGEGVLEPGAPSHGPFIRHRG